MKKIILLFVLLLSLGLTACSRNTTPTIIDNSSKETSSESISSESISSDEVSSDASSTIKKEESASQKDVSSKATSSKASSSKSTSSKPPASSNPESKPASSNPELPPPTSSAIETQFSESVVEQYLLALVNQERTSLGLSKLTWNNTLYKSAKIRSDEIAKANLGLDISHTRPNGETWSTSLADAGYSKYYAYAGENLAAVQDGFAWEQSADNEKIAKMIFDGWKNSPGHYSAIIRPETIEIGIAVSKNDTDIYATQHFGQIE
ncbi:MAG: CAP domain-containing protein [Oscillospiraceae bacterium]